MSEEPATSGADRAATQAPSANVVTFHCHACNSAMQAELALVGKTLSCVACQVDNQVPLPKIRVGGGVNRPVQRKIGKKPEEVTPDPAVSTEPAGHTTDQQNDDKAASSTVKNTAEPDKARPGQTQEKKPEKSISWIALAGLFGLFALVGWGGTTLLLGSTPPPAGVASQPINESDIRAALGHWKAARLAYEEIAVSLNVTLAEMEQRGMVDQANVVQSAIDRKQAMIAESKLRYTSIMRDVAQAYQQSPTKVEAVFAAVSDQHTRRSDPMADEFLSQSLALISAHEGAADALVDQLESAFQHSTASTMQSN